MAIGLCIGLIRIGDVFNGDFLLGIFVLLLLFEIETQHTLHHREQLRLSLNVRYEPNRKETKIILAAAAAAVRRKATWMDGWMNVYYYVLELE